MNAKDKIFKYIEKNQYATGKQLSEYLGISRQAVNKHLKELIQNMKAFKGNLIIQTLFLRGVTDGVEINNTTQKEIEAWLDLIKEVKPLKVMIYTFHRETSAKGLTRIPENELQQISEKVKKLGISTLVSP